MTYSLEFDQRALKEWHKLGDTIRQQLKKKLAEILVNPESRPTAYASCQIATK
jgi:mRNA interferase RelE/StbE